MANNKQLADFLRQQCQQRRLSLRRLSIDAGLSPATVHNIITRKYQPTLFSLNRLADYLSIKRECLWQLAGLVEDYNSELVDPQLSFHFSRVDKLPKHVRKLIISIIEVVITFVDSGGQIIEHGATFSLSGDNKGLPCPFKPILCQEGYCHGCQIYLDWQRKKGDQRLEAMIDFDSEEDIRRLLKSVYKPATPSPEFKERLLEELRREVGSTGKDTA